jgi:chorismate dehydratase
MPDDAHPEVPGAAPAPGSGASAEAPTARVERLGIVAYSNVAPLQWSLDPWPGATFVSGVPTELNAMLLAGEIDLTLISSIEFLRHRRELRALPDFSIATLGPVYSVTLFHWCRWDELSGGRIAVTTDSATSVELLRVLLAADGIEAELIPAPPDLDAMMADYDAALLIGDAALREAVTRRTLSAGLPLVTDLGEAWYRRTRLPFTFAVWASRADRPPSERLVAELRRAREAGLGVLAEVAAAEAERLGLSRSVLQRYLGNFRYHFEPPDRDGLVAFARMLLPDFDRDQLGYWER